MTKTQQLSDDNKIIWSSDDKFSNEDIEGIIQSYFASNEFRILNNYNKYYDVHNAKITKSWIDRYKRHITPNELVPSGYYKTVVDTMAGYLFFWLKPKSRAVPNERLKPICLFTISFKDLFFFDFEGFNNFTA